MKKAALLSALLFFPGLIYIFFALGTPKVVRAPIYGPREVIQRLDQKSGKQVTDTSYYRIPAFRCLTTGGLSFSSENKLDGRLYIAVFLPPDSVRTMLAILAEDIKLNRNSYNYSRFVFFLQTDTAGNVPSNAPDMAKDMKLGVDTAYTVFMSPEQFDSLKTQCYYVNDPARKKDPWQTTTDAVLIDRLGRIRGYYNIRYAADVRKMKEDVKHVLVRDEGVQTLEESTVEQKR
jgi:hypothetical protein